MDISLAIRLIQKGVDLNTPQQVWADIGAGRGTFTVALAKLLDDRSFVYAIDRDAKFLQSIKSPSSGAKVIVQQSDFLKDDLGLASLHGILMANALHYVEDPYTFFRKIKGSLMPDGRFIIVEYERQSSNAWVPFPIPFDQLKELSEGVGFHSIVKLGETPSVYDQVMIYAALLR